MNEHDLAEIDLRQADQRIRLRRGPETVTVAGVAGRWRADRQRPPPASGSGAAAAAAAATTSNGLLIKSPMVGTFYAAASPDSPPFVKVGDHVGPDTTVCIIEAMKVFNEIPAECSGQIVAVLVAERRAGRIRSAAVPRRATIEGSGFRVQGSVVESEP